HIITPFYAFITYFYSVFISANPVLFILACIGLYVMMRYSGRYPKKFFIYFFLFFPLIGTFTSATSLTRRYFFPFMPLLMPPAMIGIKNLVGRFTTIALQRIVR